MVNKQHPANSALIKEVANLQHSPSLRDPSTSPSWKSPSKGKFTGKNNREEQGSGEHITIGHESKNTPQKLLPILVHSSGERCKNCSFSIDRVHAHGSTRGNNVGEGESKILVPKGKVTSSISTSLRHRGKYSSIHHKSHIVMNAVTRRSLARKAPEIKDSVSPARCIRNGRMQQKMNLSERDAEMALVVCPDKGWKEVSSSLDDIISIGSDKSSCCSDANPESKFSVGDAVRSRKWKKNSGSILHPLSRGKGHNKRLDSRMLLASQKLNSQKSLSMSHMGIAPSDGNGDLEYTELSQNECRLPWNLSQMHNTGKHFFDLTGRSLSCETSEPGTARVGPLIAHSHVYSHDESNAPICSEISESSIGSDSESLPLLLESASPLEGGSTGNPNVYSTKSRNQSSIHECKSPFARKDWWLVNDVSQLSLSQKYRPKSFNEILGQSLVTQALSNALIKGKFASVYIFHGPRGTGKTSCAKVFAAALNCLSMEEQRPCGCCSECLVHKFGNSSIVKEVSAAGKNGIKVIKTFIYGVTYSPSPRSPHYKVLIIDDCHLLSAHSWNIFFKVLEEASKNIVFILSTINLYELPYAITSRCQKFLFMKLKESAIASRLHAISVLENLDVDVEALKLIASIADGSLRDGEMMLEQLSLLGQKISSHMVQELVGLIPEDKLVDLLDVALSADTLNTVKKLKGLVESGVEPLALMSQLAALITCILGGGYKLPKGSKRKFFHNDDLTKSKTERLRQALKVLSDADKQLRGSSDRTTWLTAALLQFAPDKSYLLPSSSADTSLIQSPSMLLEECEKTVSGPLIKCQPGEMDAHNEPQQRYARNSESVDVDMYEGFSCKSSAATNMNMFEQVKQLTSDAPELKDETKSLKEVAVLGHNKSIQTSLQCSHCEACLQQAGLNVASELEDIWQRVLDSVHSNSLRQFMQNHGKLLSIKILKAVLVAHLEFCENQHQVRAERSKKSISHAFQVTLGCVVEIKVSVATQGQQKMPAASDNRPTGLVNGKDSMTMALGCRNHLEEYMDGREQDKTRDMYRILPDSLELHGTEPPNVDHRNNSSLDLVVVDCKSNHANKNGIHTNEERLETVWLQTVQASPSRKDQADQKSIHTNEEKFETVWVQSVHASPRYSAKGICRKGRDWNGNTFRSDSTGMSKLSLGFAIQHTSENVDGCNRELQSDSESEAGQCDHNRHTGSSQKGSFTTISACEKENLRMENRSGRKLCWKLVRSQRKVKKLPHCRRPGLFYRLIPCAKSNRR